MATPQPTHHCRYCKADFSTEAKLRFHKAQALEEDEPEVPHWWCRLHDKDYRSSTAYHLHMRQYHPKEQELDCPGCGERFHRVGSVIAHIETHQCPRVTITDLLSRRHEMTSFARRLDALRGMATEASDRLNMHFEKYMIDPMSKVITLEYDSQYEPSLAASGPMLALKAHKSNSDRQSVATTTQSDFTGSDDTGMPVGAEASTMNAAPGTGWTIDTASGLNPSEQSSLPKSEKPWDEDTSGWYGNGKSTPDGDEENGQDGECDSTQANGSDQTERAPGSFQPASQALILVPDASKDVSIDPDSPDYDAAHFLEPLTGKYACPHDHCFKTFRVPEGLAIHLKNDICTKPLYTCPACGHRFRSTTALTQHVETTSRCPVKQTSFYRELLDTLTAGIADTDGYHADFTTKYTIQPLAKAALGPEPEEPKTLEEQIKHREEMFDWAEKTLKERAAARAASVNGGGSVPEMRIEWAGSTN